MAGSFGRLAGVALLGFAFTVTDPGTAAELVGGAGFLTESEDLLCCNREKALGLATGVITGAGTADLVDVAAAFFTVDLLLFTVLNCIGGACVAAGCCCCDCVGCDDATDAGAAAAMRC